MQLKEDSLGMMIDHEIENFDQNHGLWKNNIQFSD